jgi:hypothetical protein
MLADIWIYLCSEKAHNASSGSVDKPQEGTQHTKHHTKEATSPDWTRVEHKRNQWRGNEVPWYGSTSAFYKFLAESERYIYCFGAIWYRTVGILSTP